jgi:hypothetical protein
MLAEKFTPEPVIPVITVPTRFRLESEAAYWLTSKYVVRWLWNPRTRQVSGFEVIGEGGLQATVKLSEGSAI